MKTYKLSLRIWIAFASVFGFFGGWALFAHSGKPAPFLTSSSASNMVQPVNTATTVQAATNFVVPTLPPLPTLQNSTNNNAVAVNTTQPLQFQAPAVQINNFPQLITRGS